jgi:hypothetical protein
MQGLQANQNWKKPKWNYQTKTGINQNGTIKPKLE